MGFRNSPAKMSTDFGWEFGIILVLASRVTVEFHLTLVSEFHLTLVSASRQSWSLKSRQQKDDLGFLDRNFVII